MECPSCKVSMQREGARILATGCGHLFHEGCLRGWIRASGHNARDVGAIQ